MSVFPLWSAETVIRAVRGRSLHDQSWAATGVAIDSRATQNGDLFIALQGPVHDGHDHVAAAARAGAVGALVSRQPPNIEPSFPLIFVDDTFKAMELLGTTGRARASGKIIAVTGSVGKTSTKEMLRLALGAVGTTYANEGSFNNHWGVPLSLARLPLDAQYGVFELGMNHAGELHGLTQQVKPHVALITNIEAVHLEFFDSLESIADAKAEILDGLAADGIAVLNRDNRMYARLADAAKKRGIKKILSFGHDAKADARFMDITTTPQGSRITANLCGQVLTYTLNVPGEHLAMNSLGALLTAVAAGGDAEACAIALSAYAQPKGRGVMQSVAVADGSITLIDESYNASPVAVRFAARVLGAMTPVKGGRRIMALGDMKELGETAPTLHAELAAEIAKAGIDLVFCCGPMTAHLYEALPTHLRGAHTDDSESLATAVASAVRAGDIVTVKGSKSTRMDRVVTALTALSASVPVAV